MNVPITETPWKHTLNIMIYIRPVLGLSEEIFLLGLPSHLSPTHGTLNLNHPLLFIRPRITPCSQTRPKAQYIIWVFIPIIAPQNSSFPPSSAEKKWGFDFLRVKIIYFFDLHMWKHCFALPITVIDASKLAIRH